MVKFHFIDDMHVPNRVNCEHNQLVMMVLGLVVMMVLGLVSIVSPTHAEACLK